MKKFLVKAYNNLGKVYLNPILKWEQKKRPFPQINERPVEYGFSFKHLQHLCTGKILDIGPGKSSWPHILSTCGFEVTAIDKMEGYWDSFFNRHFYIVNDDITKPKLEGKFQFATCLSVLEHIKDHVTAVQNMHNLLENKGYLILTFPYNELYYHPNIYKHPKAGYGQNARSITQVYSRNEVNQWMDKTSFKIIDKEYYQVFTGEFWTFGQRIAPCLKVRKEELHHLSCILLQKNSD